MVMVQSDWYVTLHMDANGHSNVTAKTPVPVYAACDALWNSKSGYPVYSKDVFRPDSSLTIVDLALLSEIAYIDDDSPNFTEVQGIINDLFPDLDLKVDAAPRRRWALG